MAESNHTRSAKSNRSSRKALQAARQLFWASINLRDAAQATDSLTSDRLSKLSAAAASAAEHVGVLAHALQRQDRG